MASVIYRRLPRAVFQLVTFSTTKWTRTGTRDDVGWNRLLKPSKKSTRFKEANQDSSGHRENQVMYNASPRVAQKETTGNEKVFDPDHPISVSEPLKNIYATISQDSTKQTLSTSHQDSAETRLRKMSKAPKKRRKNKHLETFNSKDEPRAFHQQRPEYKVVTCNIECLIKTPIEEGKILLQKVSHCLTPSEISDFFEKLSYLPKKHLDYVRLNPKFELLCSSSSSNVRHYTNSELISILGAFVRLAIPSNVPMLKDYEQECCHRVWHFSTNELLLVADMFRYMNFGVPKFLNAMYSCMQERCSDLNLIQAMQLIYIVGEGRHAPQELLEKLEGLVERYLTSINLEEIGVVCLGFFKTSNGLSVNVMRQMGNILSENIEQISNCALVNVLKMFRFTRVDHLDFFAQVGKEAHKRIPEMGTQAIMHVVLTFAAMHIFNEDLMKAVALTMPGRVSYCRSKDLGKFLWSFGVFTYVPPNADVFYSAFINQIRKILEEFNGFPEHLLTCLMGLAFCQQFPLDLIEFALSEQFIIQTSKISLFDLKKDLLTVAGSVAIECPEYTGNTISQDLRKEITDMLVDLSDRDIHVKIEVIEATLLLQYALGGPQYVKEHMILPHTRSKDLEVHLDVNKKPIAFNSNIKNVYQPLQELNTVKITDDLLSQLTKASQEISTDSGNGLVKESWGQPAMTTCNDKPAGQRDIVKLAIQVTNRNQYHYGSEQLLGLHCLKRRQLRKLGYVVVDVPHWEWFPLAKRTKAEKVAYLRHKVFGSV